MRSFGRYEKVLAMFLAFAIGSFGLPVFASPAPAILSGKILRTGTGDPVQGAVVKLNHRSEGKIYSSTQADAQGAYSLSDIPAGTYDLAIETDGGLFLVNAPVSLTSGEKREASFSLQPKKGAAEGETGGTAGKEPAADAKDSKKKAATPWYRSGWFGTAVVVGSAVILGAVLSSSDNDEPASASPSGN
jgi:hypothetical protein